MSTTTTHQTTATRVMPDTISVRIEVDDLRVRHGYRIDSAYVEEFWTGVIGPTGVALLRLIARRGTSGECDQPLDPVELGETLGVACRGVNSPLWKSLGRLVKFGAGFWVASDHSSIAIYSHVQPVSYSRRQRWSEAKQARHDEFTR